MAWRHDVQNEIIAIFWRRNLDSTVLILEQFRSTLPEVIPCRSSEALVPMFALVAMARLLFPWGELIIGIIVDTTVLALGIFMIVTASIWLL